MQTLHRAASAERSLQDDEPGVVVIHRSMARLFAALVRDPLSTIPAACFEQRLVMSHNGGRRRAYVSDPALAHEALVRNADRLVKSRAMKQVLGTALGDGLLTADGATWRWQRQALAPGFSHDRLATLVPAMIAAAAATRDRWLALPPGTSVDIGHEMMRTTFAIIVDTMLSGPEGLEAGRIEKGVEAFMSAAPWMFALAMVRAPRWVPFPGRRRALAATGFMRATVRAMVARRRDTRAGAGGAPDDLVGILMAAHDPESGRALADAEIADNILTFIAAGHETTAVALGWTFALLARHPDAYAKLVAEVEAVTGGGPVAPHHVAQLTYAKQVVNETMRLYPPAPMVARAVEQPFTLAGVELPTGSLVFVPIYALHRHRALWDEPERFDPERFRPEAVRARHRFAFMPFGAGPRVCIGNSFAVTEATAILAVLVKALRLDLVEVDLPSPHMAITLRPTRPIRMRVVANTS